MGQSCANLPQDGMGSGETFFLQKVNVKSCMLQSKSWQQLPFSSLQPCLLWDPSVITELTHSATCGDSHVGRLLLRARVQQVTRYGLVTAGSCWEICICTSCLQDLKSSIEATR